jgi:ribosomal protein S24E
MEIKIETETKNKPLKREEIIFRVSSSRTPSRQEIAKKIAARKGKKTEQVIVEKIRQKFGSHEIMGKACVYENTERLKEIEPAYLLKRGRKNKEEKETRKTEKKEESKEKKEPIQQEQKEKPKEKK